MRKVNKRLFVSLLVGLAVLTGGVFLVHFFQEGRVRSALLYQVRRAEEQKQPDKVVVYLSRYLDFAPDDLEERVHLAKTLAGESPVPIPKARQRAIYNLETVLARDPDRVELRCLLARLAIETGRWEMAREQLALLEKADLQDGETERLRAMYEESQEHFDLAEQLYGRHIERSPHQVDSYARRAFLLRGRLKKAAEADQVIEQLVAANGDDPQAYVKRWRYRVDFGLVRKEDLERADTDVARALELAPNDAETLLAAAEKEWRAEQPDAALPYLNRGRELYPTDFRFYLSLGTVEQQARRYAAAEEALRKGAEAVPSTSRLVLLWNLANLLIDEEEQGPVNEAEFERVLKKLAKSNPLLGSTDYLQARLEMTRGRWEEAAKLLERARPSLQNPPELLNQVNLHLAACYEQLGKIADQRAAYERVILRDPQTGEVLKAAGVAKAGLARLALQQRLTNSQGTDLDVQRALVEAGLAGAPSAELKLLSVEYLAALQKFDEARKLLIEARKEDPKKVDFAIALAVLAANQGDTAEARKLLDQADQEFGDRAELRLARMQFLAKYDGSGAAAKLAELGKDLEKFSSADQAKLLRGLAEAHQTLGNSAEAKQLWTRLAEHAHHRQDARVRLLLLDLALQANDEAAVSEVLNQLRQIEGEKGTLWQYAEAVRCIWMRKRGKQINLDDARALLDQVLKARPDWPAALLTLAELEDLRNNHELAAQLYRRAFDGSRHNPLILTQLLAGGGQKPEQVEQNLLRAVELASTVPETWISYIEFLAGRDLKKAEKALVKAKEALKGLPTERLALALAPCYEALGDVDQAKAAYETALELLPGSAEVARLVAGYYMRNGNLEAARPLLKKIVDRKINATETDVAWAKSGLALSAVAGNGYLGLAEAAKLLGLRVDANGDLVEDKDASQDNTVEGLRARARLLATQTRRAARTRAVEILGDLNRRQALSPEDQFLLAQLHEAQGQWPEARRLLTSLTETQSGNPLYLAYYLQTLLGKGEAEEAQRVFTKLEMDHPVAPGSVNLGRLVLRAQLLEAHQKGDEAITLLTQNAKRTGAQPEELLLVVGSLGRQKRIKEGLDVCEQAWKTCPVEQVSGASVALLRAAPVEEDQVARVQQWLLAAIEKEPKKVALLLQLADLYDLRRLYIQAEKQYRLVLDRDHDPNNLRALNNLAWLLAERNGNGKEALALIDHAIELAGPRPELLDTRAVVKLALKQTEDALADLQRAAAEAPSAIQYFHMARAQEQAKNTDAAKAALKQAKRLGLKRHHLHPLEAVACAKLAEELDGP